MSISAAWALKDFCRQSGRVTSKAFGFEGWRWTLRVYPKGEKNTENYEKNLGVYLGVYPEDEDVQSWGWKRHVKFGIALQKNQQLHKREEVRMFHPTCQSRGWPSFAELSCVKENFMVNDCIYFLIEITSVDLEHIERMPQPRLSHCPEYRSALNDPSNSDISFQVGDRTITAHKIILRTRSEYFKNLFSSGMLECRQKVITVDDFEFDIFMAMIEYIYAGRIVQYPANIYDLARIADQYAIIGLRDIAAKRIESSMRAENACEVLLFADRINLAPLKQSAIEYVADNIDAVLETEGFNNFVASGNGELLKAVYSSLAPSKKKQRCS